MTLGIIIRRLPPPATGLLRRAARALSGCARAAAQ
jgi:hypothetical protein